MVSFYFFLKFFSFARDIHVMSKRKKTNVTGAAPWQRGSRMAGRGAAGRRSRGPAAARSGENARKICKQHLGERFGSRLRSATREAALALCRAVFVKLGNRFWRKALARCTQRRSRREQAHFIKCCERCTFRKGMR